MTLSIVIVNWNSKDYVRQCLTSLHQYCRSTDFEIIVVDGASFDGCGEMLSAEFPSAVFIQSPENVGFARANNLGARRARGSYLLLLNPDTLFIEDSIGIMLEMFSSLPDAGAVGCRLLNADRSLQTSCVLTFPTVFNRMIDSEFLRRRFPDAKLWGMAALYTHRDQATEVQAISGACILVKRESFHFVGGFTESYFMYGEDVDLCYKLWQKGQKVYHLPATELIHYGGGSSRQAPGSFSTTMMRQSWYQFIDRHQGRGYAITYRILMAISASVRMVIIPPLLIFGSRIVRHGPASFKKWLSVFLWSIGFPRTYRS